MSQPATDWLRGKQVALTGRLASMSRDEAAELVRAHGGAVVAAITRRTDVLVVGQHGGPLDASGGLSAGLRRARRLEEMGCSICIIAEEEFLARLCVDFPSQIHRLYTKGQVCRFVHVSPQRLGVWLRAGLVEPREVVHGIHYFDYQQVSWAKTLCDLTTAGVTVEQLKRSLQQLRRWLPEVDRPLAQLALLAQEGQLLIRLQNGTLAEPTGQPHLDFESEREPKAVPSATPRRREEWLRRGCDLEERGALTEAVQAYRQALLQGGADATVCFNLANVLFALGQTAEAAERFRQALELEPMFVEAWNNLGNALAERGERAAAINAYRKVLQLAPTWADAHYNLADTLEAMGRSAEARPHWEAYLRSDPDSRWARYARRCLLRHR